ncbi:hypothetical protein, partial [Streptomyces sp. NPDC056405]|uniref:hypothetical protein n=1 Tax=Streptomyces sp. NPDC056405 TaxID=3345811 RepID=UPI0035D7B6B4
MKSVSGAEDGSRDLQGLVQHVGDEHEHIVAIVHRPLVGRAVVAAHVHHRAAQRGYGPARVVEVGVDELVRRLGRRECARAARGVGRPGAAQVVG